MGKMKKSKSKSEARRHQELSKVLDDPRDEYATSNVGVGLRITPDRYVVCSGFCEETGKYNRIRVDTNGFVITSDQSKRIEKLVTALDNTRAYFSYKMNLKKLERFYIWNMINEALKDEI